MKFSSQRVLAIIHLNMRNILIYACRTICCVVLFVGIESVMIYLVAGNAEILGFLPTNPDERMGTIVALIAVPLLIVLTLHPKKDFSKDYFVVRIFPKLKQRPVLARYMADLMLIIIPVAIGLFPFILAAIGILIFWLFLSSHSMP